jgi:predicted dehydrogenase
VEFDDAHPTEKLRIYDKGYDRPPSFTQFSEYLTVRHGDIHIPRLQMTEPLEAECAEFVRCATTAATPRTDGAHGLEVVRVLEAAQASLNAGGRPVNLS